MTTSSREKGLAAVQPERQNMHLLMLGNPNYFGTLPKDHPLAKEFKAVNIINSKTTYEQLTCVGYNPQMKTLTGIVKLNLDGGYNGGACTQGSKEYVRFYIDYQRNGTWTDLGVVSFDAHDFAHASKNPLCYAVNLAFAPEQTHCCDDAPVLPVVRAILSWSAVPPANTPGYIPVWGNALDVNIQLAPKGGWICWLKHHLKDLNLQLKPEQLKILTEKMPKLPDVVSLETEEMDIAALAALYKKDVEPERIGFTAVTKAMSASMASNSLISNFKEAGLNLSKVIDFVLKSNFNTTYEEVKCVGLNRDTNRLYATITVKKPFGYAGGLCGAGSREYVAFYMDFGSGWNFMGTSSVEVHDITPVPGGGLCYHVELPVNLAKYQKAKCSETYFAKVRAILSWNLYPPDNQPGWVAPWGDWEEAWVEIRNLQGGGEPTGKKPIITTIGNIPAKKISKVTGMIDKTLDAPDASVDGYDGFSFNGTIPITGLVPEHPDSNDIGAAQLRYKIMMKRASEPDSSFKEVTTAFNVLKNVISGGVLTQSVVAQSVDAANYYHYLVDYNSPTIVTVQGDLLGVISVADSDVYEFYLETSAGYLSERCRVKVDKHAPKDVHIKVNGSEDCGTLIKGMDITGTYQLGDDENNCHSVAFEFITLRPGDSTTFKVDGVVRSFGSQVAVPVIGKVGNWSITTNNVRKCGYNIRLYAYDKTLYCYPFISYAYSFYQQYNVDTIGFCLNEA